MYLKLNSIVLLIKFVKGHWWPRVLILHKPLQTNENEKSSVTLPEPTCVLGGEHDHKGLSAEGVCSAGLTAVIIGVTFSHRHRLLPGEEGYYFIKSFTFVLFSVFFSFKVLRCFLGQRGSKKAS